MNILYYCWNEHSYHDMSETLIEMGHQVVTIRYNLSDYFNDAIFEEQLYTLIKQNDFSFLFSFNFFPVLSEVANDCKIPYVCWVYDCPHATLYSKELINPYNFIFHFDRSMVQHCKNLGAKHIFHLPLATNTKRLTEYLNISPTMSTTAFANVKYFHDISFVGSLYENCIYNGLYYMPIDTLGFLDGAIAAQKTIWGVNLITSTITNDVEQTFFRHVKFYNNKDLDYPTRELMTNLLFAKITSDERIEYLKALSLKYSCTVFSDSDVEKLCPSAAFGGYIDYQTTMPDVFRHSKINLNITLRSITSGIPLRCIDILGSGGFLLSNYQPELNEFFSEGTDFVCYHSKEEMLQLADYYLRHEEERKKIAHNGYIHACEQFPYNVQVQTILDTVSYYYK